MIRLAVHRPVSSLSYFNNSFLSELAGTRRDFLKVLEEDFLLHSEEKSEYDASVSNPQRDRSSSEFLFSGSPCCLLQELNTANCLLATAALAKHINNRLKCECVHAFMKKNTIWKDILIHPPLTQSCCTSVNCSTPQTTLFKERHANSSNEDENGKKRMVLLLLRVVWYSLLCIAIRNHYSVFGTPVCCITIWYSIFTIRYS